MTEPTKLERLMQVIGAGTNDPEILAELNDKDNETSLLAEGLQFWSQHLQGSINQDLLWEEMDAEEREYASIGERWFQRFDSAQLRPRTKYAWEKNVVSRLEVLAFLMEQGVFWAIWSWVGIWLFGVFGVLDWLVAYQYLIAATCGILAAGCAMLRLQLGGLLFPGTFSQAVVYGAVAPAGMGCTVQIVCLVFGWKTANWLWLGMIAYSFIGSLLHMYDEPYTDGLIAAFRVEQYRTIRKIGLRKVLEYYILLMLGMLPWFVGMGAFLGWATNHLSLWLAEKPDWLFEPVKGSLVGAAMASFYSFDLGCRYQRGRIFNGTIRDVCLAAVLGSVFGGTYGLLIWGSLGWSPFMGALIIGWLGAWLASLYAAFEGLPVKSPKVLSTQPKKRLTFSTIVRITATRAMGLVADVILATIIIGGVSWLFTMTFTGGVIGAILGSYYGLNRNIVAWLTHRTKAPWLEELKGIAEIPRFQFLAQWVASPVPN